MCRGASAARVRVGGRLFCARGLLDVHTHTCASYMYMHCSSVTFVNVGMISGQFSSVHRAGDEGVYETVGWLCSNRVGCQRVSKLST